jgi:hypothetical protein
LIELASINVCDWGGWEGIELFLEHYRGSYSPEVQRRELQKVEWLGDSKQAGSDQDNPVPETVFDSV